MGTVTFAAATSEHESGVMALFAASDLPVRVEAWLRSFSPDAPDQVRSTPRVALAASGEVLAYVAARPCLIYLSGQYVESQMVHDLVYLPGGAGQEAATALLDDIVRDSAAELTISGAAGIEQDALLEACSFPRAGGWGRWRFDPRKRRSAERGVHPVLPYGWSVHAGDFPPAIEAINQRLLARSMIFRQRSPEERAWLLMGPMRGNTDILVAQESSPIDAYIAVREVDGAAGRELHLIDLGCPPEEMPRMAASLREFSIERGLPLYVSMFGELPGPALEEAGFDTLRPRWSLRWRWRDPRQRATAVLRRDSWFLSPLDAELDVMSW